MTWEQDVLARRRWAAWLVESAEQAEDLTEREAQGMRTAATHLLDDEIAAKVAAIDGLDEAWASAFTARLHDRIEAHRFAVRTVRAAAASWEDEIARLRAELAARTPQPAAVSACECWVTPERMWTTHYGAVEPGSQMEQNPDCPVHPVSVAPQPAVPDGGQPADVTEALRLLRPLGPLDTVTGRAWQMVAAAVAPAVPDGEDHGGPDFTEPEPFGVDLAREMRHPRWVICPRDRHPSFLVDSADTVPCPWCATTPPAPEVHP